MSKMPLKYAEIKDLNVVRNSCEIRRDIHVFMAYVMDRNVKRAHRSNRLSKADAMKLAKIMTDARACDEVKDTEQSSWVDYVDQVALQLGFVKYDTKGQYMGYSSWAPSYPDNYIEADLKTYNDFLKLSLKDQENRVLDAQVKSYNYRNNEFFTKTVFTKLDEFDSAGCATGVLPSLDFSKVRMFLLQILSCCEPDQWYSTASLILYLKKAHRFFLIPEKFKLANQYDKGGRYGNFKEKIKGNYSRGDAIKEADSDAFERVEGRYVERFLEGIPLIMRYVDVAYDDNLEKDLLAKGNSIPLRDKLQAFRVHPRLKKVIDGALLEPKVTVQPNFEIHVESEFYPAGVMSLLKPLADIIVQDKVIILRLKKEKVAQELVRHENLDIIKLLENLSARALPQNIAMELQEWSGHSEVFTLYEGVGLFEGDAKIEEINEFVVEEISPDASMVHSTDKLFAMLEDKELVPLKVRHLDGALMTFPKGIKTVFGKKIQQKKKTNKKKSVTLKKQTNISLYFPGQEIFKIFQKKLLDERCPFESNCKNHSITFLGIHEGHVTAVIDSLKDDYSIKMNRIE